MGESEFSMRYSDLIQFEPIESVIQLLDANRPDEAKKWSAPQEVIHPLCWSEDHLDGTRDGKEASQAGRDRREAAAS